jgi:hypothetical protein
MATQFSFKEAWAPAKRQFLIVNYWLYKWPACYLLPYIHWTFVTRWKSDCHDRYLRVHQCDLYVWVLKYYWLVLRMSLDFLRLENSKRPDHLNGSLEQTNGKMNHGKTNVSSYFRRNEVVLTRCHWQVMFNFL